MAYRAYTLTFAAAGTRSSAVQIGDYTQGQILLPAVGTTPTVGVQTHTEWSANAPDGDLVNNPASDTGWAVVESTAGVPATYGTVDAASATCVMLGGGTGIELPAGWIRLTASVAPSGVAAYEATLILTD